LFLCKYSGIFVEHAFVFRANAVPAKPFLSPRNKQGQEMVPKSLLLEKQEQLRLRDETIQVSVPWASFGL
jgi:hypothetical protein